MSLLDTRQVMFMSFKIVIELVARHGMCEPGAVQAKAILSKYFVLVKLFVVGYNIIYWNLFPSYNFEVHLNSFF